MIDPFLSSPGHFSQPGEHGPTSSLPDWWQIVAIHFVTARCLIISIINHFHDITHKVFHLLFSIMHDEHGNPFQEDQQSPDLRSLPSEYS